MEANQTDIKAAMERLTRRLEETVCAKYADDAEWYAKDFAQKISGGTNEGGGSGDQEEKPVVWTAAMLKETEKKRVMGDRSPWTKLTGEARKLLKGYVIKKDENNMLGFGVAHRVSYGAYLEFANSGRHAILRPTIEALRLKFFNEVKKILGGKA